MSEQDFFQEAKELFRQYYAGDYKAALETAARLEERFPEQRIHIAYWRICLNSRLGRVDEALNLFSEALDEGLWWSEEQLRRDPDLDALRANPEFKRLLTLCRERHRTAQAASSPDLRVFPPNEAFSPPYPLLIALHGRGGTAKSALPHWKAVGEMGYLLALPQSSQLAWPGAYAWDDGEVAEREIQAHYEALRREYAIDLERVILAGASQGAALAIHLMLRGRVPARGFLAVAPAAIDVDALAEEAARGLGEQAQVGARGEARRRGYVVVGRQDPLYERARQMVDVLNRHGLACEIEVHDDLGHEFPPHFERTLAHALQFLTS